MNLQQSIRKVLREDKKTKSTNNEFSKYKDSKFNSLRDYTLQDIVDNWESLSDKKNENIKTIKHFINNPDKITDLVYDEKGLEDGYHRLIAAKILKKPRFTYRLVENLQKNIIKVLREETENKKLPYFFTRRVDHHKFEKMMRQGIAYMYYGSNSLEEFKYNLVEATLENYIFYKYDIEIEKELPKEDIDTFVKHMISVYDPVLVMYYRNMKKK